jgi:hypothetical protein
VTRAAATLLVAVLLGICICGSLVMGRVEARGQSVGAREIAEAVAIGAGRDEAREAFHAPYVLRLGGPVLQSLEIVTEFRATTFANYLFDQVVSRNSSVSGLGTAIVTIDIADEILLAGDPEALVNQVADKLLGGPPGNALRTEAVAAANRVSAAKPADRVEEVLYLFVVSPRFATLR